ncbi:hypothetical protein [uncultured Kordia sp.]|uniref:hypothetical protein n=1 Tax=uncultured Kordia sp. TaxID=507699 RepID=UPI0026233DEC|nr:hypothetical protein [uncultured Kordia sp.]
MNIKEKLASIGQNILLGILILGMMFVLVGIISNNINWIFIAIGIVIMAPYALSFFWVEKEVDKIEKQKNKEFQKFLKTADRVHIVLDEAKIVEKKHTETYTVTQDYRAAAINEISGNGHYNEERITYTYCEVTFNVSYKERMFVIEEIIHKDETSVRMHFYMQKITTLYLNPMDKKEYYLDLTFINS